ncbi:MAG TPA: DUF362 domain-containing protein [Syntrophales bacterium]|nr:DUF362 domain-containing protein [Syntrophales bacterium]
MIPFREVTAMTSPASTQKEEQYALELRKVLEGLSYPYPEGGRIAVKVHWGERGNRSYLSPIYAREVAAFLKEKGWRPFLFDTTVLYSGGRRTGRASLETAARHGYTEEFVGCPLVIGDGMDGRDVVELPGERHFKTVEVTSLVNGVDGFFIFSHFKGHLASGFGGAVKNLSMGFASRAQKQRMHADVHPVLDPEKCTRCGVCVDVCPTGAAHFSEEDGYPAYDLDLCIGCAQCIGLCPEAALRIFWELDASVFQERLVETAAAVWRKIGSRSVLVNALIRITQDCDCWPGHNPVIAGDVGFLGGYHPVSLDRKSLKTVGEEPFLKLHGTRPWNRQFEFAREIGFIERPVGDEIP